MGIEIGTVASTILNYLNPSRSPFYLIAVIGTVSIILTGKDIDDINWAWVALPIYIVLALSVSLSLRMKIKFPVEEHQNQLRFARSVGIASSMLTLSLTARAVDENSTAFVANYIICIIQMGIFLLYIYFRLDREESADGINFAQFILITSSFLVGGSNSLIQYVNNLDLREFEISSRYSTISIGLYILWAICIRYWIKHLRKLSRPK